MGETLRGTPAEQSLSTVAWIVSRQEAYHRTSMHAESFLLAERRCLWRTSADYA